jgi:hypothetical protein
MSRAEFERWREFYVAHPFDDLHRFHRPAALVSAALGGGDIEKRLAWLAPDVAQGGGAGGAGWTEADINTFKALGMTKPPRRQ